MFPNATRLTYLQRYQLLLLCRQLLAIGIVLGKALLWFTLAVFTFARIMTACERHASRHRHH